MKVIKTVPQENKFFIEETVEDGNTYKGIESGVINVYNEFKYQEVFGFGGAFTEASAYNYSLLTDDQKKDFMENISTRKRVSAITSAEPVSIPAISPSICIPM